ncbi:hypothetical protein ElyMa_006866500 [Elysia marginata]|uniref:Uncharacterized protein n=1 Tax=Elysia marginata TaxID=1093978 RepID=A0AAV4J8N2_9GAST|nr:hypothetical protein ElyMa_006866500 [Elysia marginata]
MGWTQHRLVLRLRILLLSHSNNNNFVLLLHAIFFKLCLCSVLSDRPVPWPVWVCKPAKNRRVGSDRRALRWWRSTLGVAGVNKVVAEVKALLQFNLDFLRDLKGQRSDEDIVAPHKFIV